ncbi:peptidase S8/S53 domain-containing protein [Rhizoctonia solani]|nr:peptidase S8/S53 domain-containing protein [Rhizoctonia solani]
MRTTFVVSALAFIVPALSAPTVVPITKRAGPVKPGSYLVMLKDNASTESVWSKITEVLLPSGSSITHDYRPLVSGLAVDIQGNGLTLLQHFQEIKSIEQDSIASINYHDGGAGFDIVPTAVGRSHALVRRTDGPGVPKGEGVNVYGIDTGIYKEHNCFGGRAYPGEVFTEGGKPGDDNGHGTHTAATAVGSKYGIATNAKIFEVKVLDANGSGAYSQVIAGVNWATSHFKQRNEPGVATMSLGGPANKMLEEAIQNAIAHGFHFMVAAGNDNVPADTTSPANVEAANTIGAVDKNNQKASFSNHGKFIDLWAPGVDIESAWIGGPDAKNTISGTSMATPYVAGIAAVMLSRCPKQLGSPTELSQRLKDNAKTKAKFPLTDIVASVMTRNKGIAQTWDCSE